MRGSDQAIQKTTSLGSKPQNQRGLHSAITDHHPNRIEERLMETATDPVCGMSIEASTAAGTISHGDTTYYFCSISCRERFEADPDQFTTARG